MVNLREQCESDLAFSLEGAWSFSIELTSPDGEVNSYKGQILYDVVRTDPVTGDPVILNDPIVVLRKSSLSRVPIAGERWYVRIPVEPSVTAPLNNFIIDSTKPPEGGGSLGFIRLYLTKAIQSS